MTSSSIICVRKDTEPVLKALDGFGEFHIEHATGANIEDYNRCIELVQRDLATTNYLINLLVTEKTGVLDIFRVQKQTRTRVTAENWINLSETTRQEISRLKSEVDSISASMDEIRAESIELSHVKSMLTTMDSMGVDLEAMEDLKTVNVVAASVPHRYFPELRFALAGLPIIIQRYHLSKEADFLYLAMPSKIRERFDRTLKTHHGDTFQIPEQLPHNIKKALEEVNKQATRNREQESALQTSLKKLGEQNKRSLASWKETMENVLAMLHAEEKILQSGRLAIIKGFVPSKVFQSLAQKINSEMNGNVLVLENDVAPDDPPTNFRHSRFIRPFEEITKLYGLPHYEELDPTPIIAITFPLVFGLMFGDIGHGLVLLLGGLTFGRLIKKNQTLRNLCWILAACGLGAIFAGLLFGEFFGLAIFPPLWFSPFDNVLSFLIFSLIIGVVQITSGLVLEMVNFWLKRDLVDIILTSAPKVAFYIGSVALIAEYQLNFAAWFSGPILWSMLPFAVLVLGKPVFFAVSGKMSRSHSQSQGATVSLGERFFESGDLVTRLLSNTFSYTRILALLMAHWALILVTYVVANLVGSASILGVVLSGTVVVVGNLMVIALEGLVVFVHTLRLHFYEWFSKFYEGTGTEFIPFKQKFVQTEVILGE